MYEAMDPTISLEACSPGMEDLLPVAMLCAMLCVISISSVVLWLLAVWHYARSRSKHIEALLNR